MQHKSESLGPQLLLFVSSTTSTRNPHLIWSLRFFCLSRWKEAKARKIKWRENLEEEEKGASFSSICKSEQGERSWRRGSFPSSHSQRWFTRFSHFEKRERAEERLFQTAATTSRSQRPLMAFRRISTLCFCFAIWSTCAYSNMFAK